jgi:hypothetical protein
LIIGELYGKERQGREDDGCQGASRKIREIEQKAASANGQEPPGRKKDNEGPIRPTRLLHKRYHMKGGTTQSL